jgi:hypothetical protein
VLDLDQRGHVVTPVYEPVPEEVVALPDVVRRRGPAACPSRTCRPR